MRIICIDDDPTFLTLYEAILRKHSLPGDEIVCLDSGEKGVAACRHSRADVVITDLVMPGMSGLEVLAELKKHDSSIEVMVVTGQGSVDSAVEAMKNGARDYLSKPISAEMLVQKLANIREFIGRAAEAQDYWYAKTAIEENATRSVSAMAERLDGYVKLVESLREVAAGGGSAEDKVAEIISRLDALERLISGNAD